MMKKLFVPFIVLVCLCLVFSLTNAFAETNAEVLIYTSKIAITLPNSITTTYTMPQEVKTVPADSIVECLDGVAILKVDDTQVVFEAGDKAKILLKADTDKLDVICLSGEIEAMLNEDIFKIANGQTLTQTAQNINIGKTVEDVQAATRENIPTRARLAAPPDDLMPAPVEILHASPSF